MWTIDEARDLIAELQPPLRAEMGYHIALAGGVLNSGESAHDLDLWFIPHHGAKSNSYAVATWLSDHLGSYRSLRDTPDYGPDEGWQSEKQIMFDFCGKRIDAFIL